MLTEKLLVVDAVTHLAEPSDYARTIDPFLKIITRDRGSPGDSDGRKKRLASKEFAYIYFMRDIQSPFYSQDEEHRHGVVKEAVFGEDYNWEPDELVVQGMKVYEESTKTIAIQLLKSAHEGIQKIRSYLETVDLDERDDNGKIIHKSSDVMRALKDVGAVLKSLESLEERVKKERIEEQRTRGGVEPTLFNT